MLTTVVDSVDKSLLGPRRADLAVQSPVQCHRLCCGRVVEIKRVPDHDLRRTGRSVPRVEAVLHRSLHWVIHRCGKGGGETPPVPVDMWEKLWRTRSAQTMHPADPGELHACEMCMNSFSTPVDHGLDSEVSAGQRCCLILLVSSVTWLKTARRSAISSRILRSA